MQLPYDAYQVRLGAAAEIPATAAVIGRTVAGARLALRDYATIRADGESIRIGDNAWFGERATVHIVDDRVGTVIGDDLTAADFSLIHGCTVGDRVVVGEGAAVMDGATVGDDALIAADAIVAPGKKLRGGWLYEGVPAQPVREVSPAEVAEAATSIRACAPLRSVRSTVLPAKPESAAGVGGESVQWWEDRQPRVQDTAYVAPSARLIGDVELGADAGVYFGCVVAARGGRVVIGARANVQDNSFLLTTKARGDLILEEGVTIGHNVQMGAGTFGADALIGMMSRVEDGVVVEPGGCIAAGAWVARGTVVKSGWIWAGRPARAFRELRQAERVEFARGRDVYIVYGAAYRAADRLRRDGSDARGSPRDAVQ